jgi:hypothetical protein
MKIDEKYFLQMTDENKFLSVYLDRYDELVRKHNSKVYSDLEYAEFREERRNILLYKKYIKEKIEIK